MVAQMSQSIQKPGSSTPLNIRDGNYIRACPQLVWRLWNLAAGGSNPNRKENGSESDEERGSVMPVRRDWGFTNHRLSDSWEVGFRRADRWSALDYAMTNGIGSRIFCPAVRAT